MVNLPRVSVGVYHLPDAKLHQPIFHPAARFAAALTAQSPRAAWNFLKIRWITYIVVDILGDDSLFIDYLHGYKFCLTLLRRVCTIRLLIVEVRASLSLKTVSGLE